ncbi:hypothetical protein KY331_04070 [Candidatus Woesearchaeota archaeon]|nr:hypothetical protein [Candidatus Woesearchaeota archaeon]
MKLVYVLMVLIVGVLATSVASAASVPVQIQKVYVNGAEFDITAGEIRGDIERADSLDIEVKVRATGDDEHVSVEAEVRGLEHDRERANDQTNDFTIKNGRSYYKKLELTLPDRMDSDQYALRIEVANRKDDEVVENLILEVGPVRHGVKIKDVVFSPDGEVRAGRSLLTSVRLKNIGEFDEEDVKVTVEIPDLGISAADYIDDVEADDSVTSEELWMRVPAQAQPGEYKAVVTVEFNEGDDEVREEYEVTVVSDTGVAATKASGKTIINVGGEVQNVVAGESGVIYPVSLTNGGLTSRTYTIGVNVGDWAEIRVNPNVVVLGAGETKIVYVYVAAKEVASEGEQTFGVEIKSGDELLKEIVLKANVAKGASGMSGFKKGLEIVLVVLVVLLFVIGLIIGFSRLRGNEEEDLEEEQKEDEQNYY